MSVVLIALLLFSNLSPYVTVLNANTVQSTDSVEDVLTQESTSKEQNIEVESKEPPSEKTTEPEKEKELHITDDRSEVSEPFLEEEETKDTDAIEQHNSEEPTEKPQQESNKNEKSQPKQQLETTTTIDFQTLPSLLITEIMPNNDGADNYEYFEVYNNSDQTIVLDYYTIALRYLDGSTKDDIPFEFPEVKIDSGETLVFWRNPGQLSVNDFNSFYQTDLPSDKIVMYQGTGFYNSGDRGIVIEDAKGEVVTIGYLGSDIDSGKVVTYQFPTEGIEMEKYQTLVDPSPGQVEEEQIPAERVVTDRHTQPTIDHQQAEEVEEGKSVTIQATITDDQQKVNAELFYRSNNEKYKQLEMKEKDENIYEASIEAENVTVGTLDYYIIAKDPNHTVRLPKNEDFSVDVMTTEESEEDFQQYPHLLITELSPNTAGPGTDYFEYFEVYNNSNQTLPLQQYASIYYYTDSGKEVSFQVPAVEIAPEETLVFWYNNGNRTLADFNNNFSTNLSNDQVVQVTDSSFPGFANGGNRALIIRNAEQEEVVYADYDGADNDNTGAVIQYKYPLEGTSMLKWRPLAAPTPGTVNVDQVPVKPVDLPEPEMDTSPPEIHHEPIKEAKEFSSILVEATITDDVAIPTATLYVKSANEEYRSISMTSSSDDPSKYNVEIAGTFVDGDLTYYIETTDGVNISKSDEFVIKIQREELDTNNLPPLLVTEVVPDSTNVGSADGYEFIEIYNNTNQPIPFEHYKMQYRYGSDPASDVIWPSVPDDLIIPAQETLVFWIINGQNNEKTVADFNANYDSKLTEGEDIVRIESAGMANGSMRGLIVASNIGHEYAIAYYNDADTEDDTLPNKGIVYKYPSDGSNNMEKISAGSLDATPGMVEEYQIPNQPVQVINDTTPPSIETVSEQSTIKQTENLDITAKAFDAEELKTVSVYYRTNPNKEFIKANIEQSDQEDQFSYRIYAPEMIGQTVVEYYFTASDGVNTVETEIKTVSIENNANDDPLRLNVSDQEIINETFILKGTSELDDPSNLNLMIDENQLEGGYRAIENTAYFAFEVSGINTYFQNGVTIGDEVIHIFDDWMAQWETITVPLDPNFLAVGENIISIRAGNKASPWEGDPDENRDDFNLRNVRLVLADGTILTDPNHINQDNVLDMGDDGTDRIVEDFTFTISEDIANSYAYAWDTTNVSDGTHQITISDSSNEIKREVYVDNTGPSIESTIVNGETIKGSFTIDAVITDEIAGVKDFEVVLDGKQIQLPYQTSSGDLSPGEHVLTINATDEVGNDTEKVYTFETVEENPLKPENSTVDKAKGDPTLKVRVNDPMGDKLDVDFYQGFQYKPSDTEVVASYQGSSPIEPPDTNQLSDASAFAENDISAVSEKDGKYVVTDDTDQFPYHRFDVELDPSIDEEDQVELEWHGNSLEGRKVTMYAWNFTTSKWDIVDYQIAGSEDFSLKGNVEVATYSDETNQIQVIIQDEIPSSNDQYDYTFVWMSDTQYYSESYPHIFERQTEWIVENQKEMKIEYVFHSGDLVDEADQEYQWLYADEYMKKLDDASIPYGVLAGNHDVLQKTEDYTEYYKYFGEDRFINNSFYGGSYLNNRGHYDLISVDGNDYIMMYLGWGITDEGITWMNEVLKQHPDRTAILTFHEYLQATGTRHPLGEKLYQEVVLPNENVVAVLSGHYHEAQTLIDEIDDDGDGTTDRKVYQMLADYQAGPEGGQGYMRLLHFDGQNNQIIVNTYSPYIDDYNYYDSEEYPNKDEFVIDLDLTPKEKRVATDAFSVNVYTDTLIGSVEGVESGNTAEVTWTGLTEGEQYFWYSNVTDRHSGSTRSELWSLVKGEDEQAQVDEDDKDEEQPERPNPDKDLNDKVPTDPGIDPIPVTNEPDINDDSLGFSDQENFYNRNIVKKPSSLDDSLPSTATNIFTFLLTGLLLLMVGIAVIIWKRKKIRSQI